MIKSGMRNLSMEDVDSPKNFLVMFIQINEINGPRSELSSTRKSYRGTRYVSQN